MPRRRGHNLGALVAALVAWEVVRRIREAANIEIDPFYAVFDIAVFFGVTWVGSRFPDLAEPAEHPQHRGFIHSLGFFVLLVISSFIFLILLSYPLSPLLFAPATNLRSFIPHLMLPFLAGHASHLLLDAFL